MKVDHRAQLRHPEHPNPSASLKAARAVGLQGQTVESRDGDRGVAPAGTLQLVESGARGPAALDFAAPKPSLGHGVPSATASLEVVSGWRPEGQAPLEERPGGALGNTAVNLSALAPSAARSKREAWDLRDALRPFAVRERVRDCGYRIAPHATDVEVRQTEGRAALHLGGLVRCESPWECPACARQIRAQHGEDVTRVVTAHIARHGAGSVMFGTFTVRHGRGSDFKALAAGLSAAWTRLQQGREWVRWRARHQGIATIRALEVTHGANGFHPHLHVALLLGSDLRVSERSDLDCRAPVCRPRRVGTLSEEAAPLCDGALPAGSVCRAPRRSRRAVVVSPRASLEEWHELLTRRWSAAVARSFGGDAAFAPSERRGVDLQIVNEDDAARTAAYIAKSIVALELTATDSKVGRRAGRSMWQVARDLVEHRRPTDLRIWAAFCAGIRGRRFLAWSVGLREEYLGQDEDDDVETVPVEPSPEVVEEDSQLEVDADVPAEVEVEDAIRSDRRTVVLATIPRDRWMLVWNRYGLTYDICVTGELALADLDARGVTDQAQRAAAVQLAVDALLEGWVGEREALHGQIDRDRDRKAAEEALLAEAVA